MLDADQQRRIAEAVAEAERRTSGEIVCLFERRLGGRDRTTPLLVGGGAALLLPTPILAARLAWIPTWAAAQAGGEPPGMVLGEVAVLQAACFVAGYALASVPAIRRALTPRAVVRRRVHEAALQRFASRGLHQTRDRTAVLIFVVEEERHVEIVADRGIYEKVAPEVWGDATEALLAGLRRGDPAGGFTAAVAKCGEVLAAHFPPRPDDRDELPNHVVVVDAPG